ncbi:MAG TPA: tetratricopeptide repeat protein, partial [Gemmataceae bacterium]|nr:tetratricopeptide repeat protein [Gemmataceae bacterium]
ARAASSYEDAIRDDPRQLEAYLRLALLYQYRLDQPEKAGRVFDALVRYNSSSAEAYLARAIQGMTHGSLSEAGRDLLRARELAPEDAHVLLAAAELERRRGRLPEARRFLLQGRAREPGNLTMHLNLARLERESGHPREAVSCLRQGLQALPDQPDLMLLLAETLVDVDDEPAVEELIQRLRRPGSPPSLAHYLHGRLQMHRKQWMQAIHTLEEVIQSPACAPALASRSSLFLAHCYEQVRDRVRQLAVLRQAVALDKASATARLELAAALQRDGRIEEALEQYREVVTMGQAPEESWVLLGRLLVQRIRSLPARKRRWSEVEKVLERAAHFPTLEVSVAILRAEVLREQGRAEQARALLEKPTAAHPEALEPWLALADLALRQGELARALQVLEQARQRLSNRHELYAAEITLALGQQPRQAKQLLRQLEKQRNRLPSAQQPPLLAQLATAYFRLGEREEGRRLCRLLAQQAPAELPSLLVVLDLAFQGGDATLLARLTEELRRLEGEEGTWWRYAEAARLLLSAQRGEQDAKATVERTRVLVKDLVRLRPSWPRAALLEASLHELEGEPAEAANAYLRAFRGGEGLPGLVERMTGLLVEQGRLDEADEVIRRFAEQTPPSADLARLGAEIALRMRSMERARELARLAVPKGTNDYQQLIWLGQVLGQAGRPAEGEEALRQAVRLRGDLAETWLALLAHLARIEQETEAERAREEMRRSLPAEQLPLALAVADEALAHWQLAEEEYRQALAGTPHDVQVLQRTTSFYVRLSRVEQAEPLLRRLLAANVPMVNQAWARRQLALLLAFAGDDKYREALALLPRSKQGKEESALDSRTRLLVEATRPAARRDAVRRLEASSKRYPFLPEELFCLVRLYEADKNARTAHERMLDLLALDPKNPEYLAHHIERLLQQGRTDEARPWITRLKHLEPESQRVQRFKRSAFRSQRSAKSKD